jgi:RHS repeat-associated protein
MISIPICFSLELNLTYDNNGNLITGDGKYREYNEFNQLVRVYNGTSANRSNLMEAYIYHPTEDRVLVKLIYPPRDDHNQTIIYVNDNFVRTIVKPNPHGDVTNTTDKIYIKDENGIIAEFNSSQNKLYYYNDHLGSTSVITNESGGIVEQTFYEPFGGIISGGNVSRFYYQGKDYSPTIGEYDFNFRKYNPDLKIFTKPDETISNVYDPQSLNRYSFEKNSPYKYVDKNGKNTLLAVGITGFFLGALYYNSLTPIDERNSKWNRVWKAYTMGAIFSLASVATFGFIMEGGYLRLAGTSGIISNAVSRVQIGVTAGSIEAARQVLAEQETFDPYQVIYTALGASSIPPRSFGAGQFTGVSEENSIFSGNIITSQSTLAIGYTTFSYIASNELSKDIENVANSLYSYYNNQKQSNSQIDITYYYSGGQGYCGNPPSSTKVDYKIVCGKNGCQTVKT